MNRAPTNIDNVVLTGAGANRPTNMDIVGLILSSLSYNATAKTLYCNTYVANAGIQIRGAGLTNGGGTGGAFGAGSVCDPGFTISMIGFVTRWTPVKNLTFSAEFVWFHLDQKFAGTAALTPAAPKPGAAQGARYEFSDQDAFSLGVRVQRNF